jgi:Mitochondrial carrier protein
MSKDTHPLIAGFTAGVVSTSLLLPLDVVKVSLHKKWRVHPLEFVVTF